MAPTTPARRTLRSVGRPLVAAVAIGTVTFALVPSAGTASSPVSTAALTTSTVAAATYQPLPAASPVAVAAPAALPVATSPLVTTTARPGSAAAVAIAFALAQIGLPYVWGGDGPAAGEEGFDCSGLTTAAYAAAGIALPRTAHTQFYAGPHVPDGAPLEPGDLVFYGVPERVHHVGLHLGEGRMVNAPTFGKPVQTAYVRYPGDDYLGATRPAAGRDATGLLATPALPYRVPAVPEPDVPKAPTEFPAPPAPLPTTGLPTTGLPTTGLPTTGLPTTGATPSQQILAAAEGAAPAEPTPQVAGPPTGSGAAGPATPAAAPTTTDTATAGPTAAAAVPPESATAPATTPPGRTATTPPGTTAPGPAGGPEPAPAGPTAPSGPISPAAPAAGSTSSSPATGSPATTSPAPAGPTTSAPPAPAPRPAPATLLLPTGTTLKLVAAARDANGLPVAPTAPGTGSLRWRPGTAAAWTAAIGLPVGLTPPEAGAALAVVDQDGTRTELTVRSSRITDPATARAAATALGEGPRLVLLRTDPATGQVLVVVAA